MGRLAGFMVSCSAMVTIVGVSTICRAEGQVYKYTYKSANYTTFVEGGTCLTGVMHMTLTLNLSAPIPPNSVNYFVSPISWTASNGLHHFSSSSKGAHLDYGLFDTNSKGKITNWDIDVSANPKGPLGVLEYAGTVNQVGGNPEDAGAQYPCPGGANEEAYSYVPRSWIQPKN
jgi:hypothetical protein